MTFFFKDYNGLSAEKLQANPTPPPQKKTTKKYIFLCNNFSLKNHILEFM